MAEKQIHFRNVALLRHRDGLTQAQLASKLGTTQQSVNRWETGVATPPTNKAVMMADIFGTSLDEIAGLCPIQPRRATMEEKMLQFRKLEEGDFDGVDALTKSVFDTYQGWPDHLSKVCRGIEALASIAERGGPSSATELVEAILAA